MSTYDADDWRLTPLEEEEGEGEGSGEGWTDRDEGGTRYGLEPDPHTTPTVVDADEEGVRAYGPLSRVAFASYRDDDDVGPEVDDDRIEAVASVLDGADGQPVGWGLEADVEGGYPRAGYVSVRPEPGLVVTGQVLEDGEVEDVDYAPFPKVETLAERTDDWSAAARIHEVADPTDLANPFDVDLDDPFRRVEAETTTVTASGGSYYVDRFVLTPLADLVDETDVVNDIDADRGVDVSVVTPDDVDRDLVRYVEETVAGDHSVAALSGRLHDAATRLVDDLSDDVGGGSDRDDDEFEWGVG